MYEVYLTNEDETRYEVLGIFPDFGKAVVFKRSLMESGMSYEDYCWVGIRGPIS